MTELREEKKIKTYIGAHFNKVSVFFLEIARENMAHDVIGEEV